MFMTKLFSSTAKVRRLYDIANILSSLQLIEKVHIHSIQTGRKPGFRWRGIDPDKLELVAYTQGKYTMHKKSVPFAIASLLNFKTRNKKVLS